VAWPFAWTVGSGLGEGEGWQRRLRYFYSTPDCRQELVGWKCSTIRVDGGGQPIHVEVGQVSKVKPHECWFLLLKQGSSSGGNARRVIALASKHARANVIVVAQQQLAVRSGRHAKHETERSGHLETDQHRDDITRWENRSINHGPFSRATA
jgi:hypothetical protein